jgi:hypothetical protein
MSRVLLQAYSLDACSINVDHGLPPHRAFCRILDDIHE